MSEKQWLGLLGLAGGIDKDGSRAAELLAAGFDSVEFGTVTPQPEPGINPGVAALAARLAALAASTDTRIGIGIGMGDGIEPAALAAEWVCGLRAAWDAADYLSFNLSARRYRPLLSAEHLPLLRRAMEAVAAERQRRTKESGRHVALTLKLPLGSGDLLPLILAEAAADAGFDAVTAVLPEHAERLARLRHLAARLRGKAALVAVGGIRDAGDIAAALACGASGVQVHTAFAQRGAACLASLRGR
ncbi:nitronate monooxygenase [Noviherbaspirillum autotrophicum]|uniref:Dihydroorotate dehydrogenase n=1 Tax=Noviherbaspirillum autotrophicum TaxID=709839 RepID=A0A0C2BKI2_9BURK|nr:nitronate monooxygenase [Noviherbaspirillum autotrophicum]KIF80489.1 hypothetical protein TSA66_06130 [Noviherbaspirillum autotrophicum]